MGDVTVGCYLVGSDGGETWQTQICRGGELGMSGNGSRGPLFVRSATSTNGRVSCASRGRLGI